MVLTVVIVLILISLAVYLGYAIHLALKPDARLASVMAETELAKIGGEPRTLKINLDDTKVVIMKKSEGFGIYTNDPELKCSCDEEKIEITSTSEKRYNARRYVKIVLPEILSFENVIIRQTSGGIEGDLLSCKNLDIRTLNGQVTFNELYARNNCQITTCEGILIKKGRTTNAVIRACNEVICKAYVYGACNLVSLSNAVVCTFPEELSGAYDVSAICPGGTIYLDSTTYDTTFRRSKANAMNFIDLSAGCGYSIKLKGLKI